MCLPSHSAIQAMFLATWHYRPAARAKLFVRNGCLLPWSTWHSPSVVGQWCSLSLQKLRYQYLTSTWCNLIQELPCVVQTISDCRARFAQVFALIKKRSLAGLTCAHRGLSIDICTLVRNHTLADAKLLNKAVITDGPSRMPRSPSLPSLMTIQNLKHRRGKIVRFLFQDIPRLWIAMIAMQMQCRRPFSTCWWDLQGVDTLLSKRRPSWTTPLEQAWTTPSRSRIKSHQGWYRAKVHWASSPPRMEDAWSFLPSVKWLTPGMLPLHLSQSAQ